MLDACALNEWLKPFAASGIRYIRKNYILQYGPNCIRKKADLQAVLDYIKQSNPMAEIMIDKTRVMDLFCDLPPDNAKLAENLAHYSWVLLFNQNKSFNVYFSRFIYFAHSMHINSEWW